MSRSAASSHSPISSRLPLLLATRPLVGLVLGSMLACQPPDPPPPAPAPIPVTTEVVAAGPFSPGLRLLGTAAPSGLVELRPPGSGPIRYPDRFASGLRTGEPVSRGELLFEIDDADTRLALVEQRLSAKQAETDLERSRRGVEEGFLPASDLDQKKILAELARERLAAAEREVARLRFEAPASGTLRVEEIVAPGTEVGTSNLLGAIATDGDPKVEAWASAADLELLRSGLAVECLDSRNDRVLGRGSITELAREVDSAGVARLVVTVSELIDMPRAGVGVALRVLLPERPSALTVPDRAVITNGGVTSVFVLEPSGDRFEARSRLVRLGQRGEGRIEILDGAQEGDLIALEGAEYLSDGVAARDVGSTEDG